MSDKTPMIMGIDYGSKLAGTTAVAVNFQEKIIMNLSEKKKDADRFLSGLIYQFKPEIIAIDAPLSLPSGLLHPESGNYFYRLGDKELNAMSPMFLGGLTARAIQLRDKVKADFPKIKIIETYPKAQWTRIDLDCKIYKKGNISDCIAKLVSEIPDFLSVPLPGNWHEFDALLAWIGGFRYYFGTGVSYGTEEEGKIYV